MTDLVRMLGLARTIEASASIFVEEREFDEITSGFLCGPSMILIRELSTIFSHKDSLDFIRRPWHARQRRWLSGRTYPQTSLAKD